ncbi:MAG: GNAT family N-acetyltransferase [Tepidibacter sp.]|uniref:GNAT family N-acetyltransferase n=1 Tax=Tepidibacter sp. TaxID=2529387 RepID=UPI0025D3DF29|nr:GNAT family N-acetyltransferase [Tepidibacter sp.]MCT4509723.1 GNAT family N-acetyltransferase [Tepidibacter sp.]MCT4584784.1 GNAT family N-acetyltransferase [Peptostreptococcaceae bacterium]
MIYSFRELSKEQRKKLYCFIKEFGFNFYFNTYEEMLSNYSGVLFDNGKSYFTLWDKEEIKGTIGVISKDIKENGEIFFASINIYENNQKYFEKLLKYSIEYAKKYNPNKIKLGLKPNSKHIMSTVKKIGFREVYKAVILRLECSEKLNSIEIHNSINFENLSDKNKDVYKVINNESFRNSPNCGVMTDKEIKELLKKRNEKSLIVGIIYSNEEPVGIYELHIQEGIGWVDTIGILPKFQGNKFGKILLKKSINILKQFEVEDIKLIVISSNNIGYSLYKKYGFVDDEILSYWFEK